MERAFLAKLKPRYLLVLLVLVLGLIWVLFFDSYSVVQRLKWTQERDLLLQENQKKYQEQLRLQGQLNSADPDELNERSAREHFGMRKPGETIYRVVPEDSTR